MSRDLPYPMRRLIVALIAATTASVILFVFFCPVRIPSSSWVDLFGGLTFRPVWKLDGRFPDLSGLHLEGAAALFVGFVVWFYYTDFKPPPPPEPRSGDSP